MLYHTPNSGIYFNPNFDFATKSVFVQNSDNGYNNPIVTGDFLLLEGDEFLLLDGTNLLLL